MSAVKMCHNRQMHPKIGVAMQHEKWKDFFWTAESQKEGHRMV